jgi:hypothetical protein
MANGRGGGVGVRDSADAARDDDGGWTGGRDRTFGASNPHPSSSSSPVVDQGVVSRARRQKRRDARGGWKRDCYVFLYFSRTFGVTLYFRPVSHPKRPPDSIIELLESGGVDHSIHIGTFGVTLYDYSTLFVSLNTSRARDHASRRSPRVRLGFMCAHTRVRTMS